MKIKRFFKKNKKFLGIIPNFDKLFERFRKNIFSFFGLSPIDKICGVWYNDFVL